MTMQNTFMLRKFALLRQIYYLRRVIKSLTPLISFLQLVAQDLHGKLHGDFSRTAVIFPGKRAGLFLSEYLTDLAGGAPIWAPRYMTINELFDSLAEGWATADPIDATLRIIEGYRDSLPEGQGLNVEWFYGWAERILADFDDVDKNMAPADALFRHIAEWRELEDLEFLTEEQRAELRRFFNGFDPEQRSEIRQHFQQLWDHLGDLYHRLNDSLAAERIAYEGALLRRIVERLQKGEVQLDPSIDHYAIVGFNVLDRVEQELFAHLRSEGRAWFYWDYDPYYTRPNADHAYHEAGEFLRHNMRLFPGELPISLFDNLRKPRRIEMISATTEAIQARYVGPWLQQHLTPDARRTAIVLCNEAMLQPVLHALPANIDELNVTKGFPLSHTEAATLVERKFNEWEREAVRWEKRGEMYTLAAHLQKLTEYIDTEGRRYVNREGYDAERFEDILQGEAFYMLYTLLNRFARILERHQSLDLGLVTLRRLVRGVIRQQSVPFHGEPVVGLQVMGMLETRCLDFDHILLLSAGDGLLPQKVNDNSFIPYLLRRSYGLTTPERRVAVVAYYFYRLIQRARLVTLTYNVSTEGMSTGEMSRFMTQLLVEWPGRIHHYTLTSSQQSDVLAPLAIDKPVDHLKRITKTVTDRESGEERQIPTISPTAMSDYLKCQLKYYFRHVEHIREPEEEDEEMSSRAFGNIFHTAAELVYKDIRRNYGGDVLPEYLDQIIKSRIRIAEIVRQAFEEREEPYRVLEGRVIGMYLRNLLRFDRRYAPFKVVDLERHIACLFPVKLEGEEVQVRFSGIIDRVDIVGETLRIVDYKTGAAQLMEGGHARATVAHDIASIFRTEDPLGYVLQTFLYGTMLRYGAEQRDVWAAKWKGWKVQPVLYYTRMMRNLKYNPGLVVNKTPVDDYAPYAEEFEQHIRALIEDILDPTKPFVPTQKLQDCEKCGYRAICWRTKESE